jgi:hypothetical protein
MPQENGAFMSKPACNERFARAIAGQSGGAWYVLENLRWGDFRFWGTLLDRQSRYWQPLQAFQVGCLPFENLKDIR